ncbi:MAG TPA: hypothetical protein VIY29_14345, partial [Ktedonobacteraceae bacterium]
VVAGRCTGVLVVVLRGAGAVVVATSLAGAGLLGALTCCAGDFVALLERCAGVARGVFSAGASVAGCVAGAVDFLEAVVLLVRGVVAEREVRGTVSDGAEVAAAEVVARARVAALLAVSVTFWVGGATVAPLAEAVDVVRRLVAGFASCSEFSCLLGTALSVLERVLVRLLVVAGFTCSFSLVSGDSDVFFMKKTPFYRMMRL